jgi:hypothetical protein
VSAPKFTPAELSAIVDIALEQDPDRAIRRLRETFTNPDDEGLLSRASEAVDRLRAGQPVDLGNGEVFMRDSGGPTGPILRSIR